MNLYREFPPPPLLSAHVACLWTSLAMPAGAAVRRRILPDNCIDILWQDATPHGFVVGMMSAPRAVSYAALVRTVAVRFRPGAARAFFDLPLALLQDERVSLPDLCADAEELAEGLWNRDRDDKQRMMRIARWLGGRLARTDRNHGGLARAAVRLLEDSGGTMAVAELASNLAVSRQHLALQFREHVGLPPKKFAMVCRFRRASTVLRGLDPHDIDWPMFACDMGYYDQSHLINDFNALSGHSPMRLQG